MKGGQHSGTGLSGSQQPVTDMKAAHSGGSIALHSGVQHLCSKDAQDILH